MRPLKEKISITIDSDLLEKLREKAEEDCRPLSQYINLILRKYMELAPREDFKDILEAIDRFVYFDSRKVDA